MQYIVESHDLEGLIVALESRERNFMRVKEAYDLATTKPVKDGRHFTFDEFTEAASEYNSILNQVSSPHFRYSRSDVEKQLKEFEQKYFPRTPS